MYCFPSLLIFAPYVFTADILVYNPMFGFSNAKFLSQITNVLADGKHQITAFQLFHFDLKNTEGLFKNKNVEIFNYYPEHFHEDTFDYAVFWDSPADNNPILDAFLIANIFSDGFKNMSSMATTRNVVEIGGLSMDLKKMRKAEKLPEEYEKKLQEREATVLISFGSVVRSIEMPDRFKSRIIKMINDLPNITFTWKYEVDDIEFQKGLQNNVHVKKWVPQSALLSDDRLKLFITHGGLGSTMELAYSGKPSLTISIFGDQPHNAVMLARHGGAIAYDKYNLSDGKKLTETVKQLIGNPKYKENAQLLLHILKNQPFDPKEELLKRFDFAVKIPQHRSFVPEISRQGAIAFFHLDALVVIFLS